MTDVHFVGCQKFSSICDVRKVKEEQRRGRSEKLHGYQEVGFASTKISSSRVSGEAEFEDGHENKQSRSCFTATWDRILLAGRPTHRLLHDDDCDVSKAMQQRRWVLALTTCRSHMYSTHSCPVRVSGVEVRECPSVVRRHGSGGRHRCRRDLSTC